MTDDQRTQQQLPQPDPALRELDFLVGKWSMKGRLVGSDEENIVGGASFDWLPGGFFLRQRVRLDFADRFAIESEELIGHNPETGQFKSYVFSNMSPEPLPYQWEVSEGSMKITVSHGPLDATFTGRVGEDGNAYSGSWRPNPGVDETVNVPYDISGERLR
jgi:Protein of unknown function (DUF1579)